ncbi:heme-binding protein [Natronomonas salina]|uniref:heme-binding protein n=1 Tax=Natronomonas salina TaxID=1710540 RepID=UPI0015B416AB|nr:heme-binding protein [Natronomonas salina]QLD88862.1 heme-binding protein [Natronomonas salina]
MVRRRPPGTEEGWYALHDLRHIDWDSWRAAPDRERERAVEEGIDYLQSHAALADAEEGGSAVFSIVGHKADLLILHLRPTLEHLDRAERRFESTALAEVTERASSYVSVTEVSGYMHEDLTDGLDDIEDAGMRNYMKQRIYPEIPDADHVCFYPMDKRRGPEDNWYDLPFEERAEYMSAHGDIGREYAGKVTQIITGSVGLDDHEWGVTLFADDPTDIKHLLYEMRFDPSSSRFAEFGPFYVGRQFPPEDLRAVFDGEAVPTDRSLEGDTLDLAPGAGEESHPPTESGRDSGRHHGDADSGSSGGGGRPSPGDAEHDEVGADEFLERADRFGVDAGDAGYGLLFESDADSDELEDEVEELAGNFDHYDTHAGTTVHSDGETTAVVSLWANERAANTASGFLSELPGVDGGVGASLDADSEDGSGEEDDDGDESASGGGGRPGGEAKHEELDPEEFQRRVHRFGVSLDEHPEAGYALLFRSETDAEELVEEVEGLRENFEHYDTHVLTTVRADSGDTAVVSLWANERAANTASGFLSDLSGAGPGIGANLGDGESEPYGTDEDDDIRGELADLDVYAGKPHGEDVYAMVLYSEADPEELESELADLAERFEHYDTHVTSAVYADEHGGDRSAVVSVWETKDAADKAGGFLSDLPGIVARAGESSNFGTMGMFYTVKPEHREDFVETFEEVGEKLADLEGHLETSLLVNVDDENDMFIASQWREREDAMEFFRSDAFRETVQWGRDVLADRPRHVFLA